MNMHTINSPWSSPLMMDRISLDDVPHKGNNRGNDFQKCHCNTKSQNIQNFWIVLLLHNFHQLFINLNKM